MPNRRVNTSGFSFRIMFEDELSPAFISFISFQQPIIIMAPAAIFNKAHSSAFHKVMAEEFSKFSKLKMCCSKFAEHKLAQKFC